MTLPRFIYIRHLPGVSVLRPMAFCAYFICPLAVLRLQLNTCVPCAAPLAKLILTKEVRCKIMELSQIIMIVVGLVVGIAAGVVLGILSFKKKYKDADEKIKNADNEALRIYNERISSGENRKKELLLEAKDEIHKLRT